MKLKGLGASTLALVMIMSIAQTARADDEALVRFERGVQLYEAENFDAALVEFNSAYKLSHNYKLLYNIAICQMATKDYAVAADSFRQYLNDGGAEIAETRRKDVNERLSKLSLMIARVRVTSNAPAGTVLLVDEHPVAKLPLGEPITVKTGRRSFSVNVAGKVVAKTVDVTSGEQGAVDLVVEAAAPAPTVVREAPPPKAQASGPSFPWVLWGVTGILGGAAAVTGTLAVGARNDLGEARAEFNPDRAAIDDHESKAKTFGLVTDGLLVGTVLAGGFATYFTIRWATAKKPVQGQAASPGATGGLTFTPTGMQFTRSF